jgi:hypothetical protein
MIATELPRLRAELEGLELSLRAKRHIAGAMKRTGPVSVNIEVKPETAEALREAMKVHNLVRDAFMSRLVIFLRSNDALLDHLNVPRHINGRGSGRSLPEMPASPLGAMGELRDDPLFYVRSHIEGIHRMGIYRVQLPRQVDWAACYLADEDIPGTAAHRRQEKLTKDWLSMLDDVPVRTPTKNRRTKK